MSAIASPRRDLAAVDPVAWFARLDLGVGVAIMAAGTLAASREAVATGLGRPVDMGAMLALCGVAVALAKGRDRRTDFAAFAAAFLVLALGVLALLSPVVGHDWSLSSLVFYLDGAANGGPVPRSLSGGLCMTLLGLSLLGTLAGRPHLGQGLALSVLGISVIGLLNNAYIGGNAGPGLTVYLNIRSTTAAIFTLAALTILARHRREGLPGVLFGSGAGSDVARRLMPIAILAPLALNWVRFAGQSFGLFDLAFGTALSAGASMLVMIGMIWHVAIAANRLGAERLAVGLALQRSNSELAKAAAELRAANAELESFAYTVAHDLRAPLRAIDGFSRGLVEDYARSLDPEAARLLGVVRRNAIRMGTLMDDLLAFSRLSRQPLSKHTVDPRTIVQRVLDEGARERDGRALEIAVGALPPCQADPRLLTQVYANLIGNAVKYTRKAAPARIVIGSREDAGRTVYFVADNGAGFDMAYAAKLFGVFQRLHRAEEFEGTGVGLAIVQRVVHRHGGTVWAEARPNAGATFFFTLG